MEDIQHWHLCDEVTIIQAVLLIVNEDPSHIQYYVENWNAEKRPKGYEAVFAALKNAIMSDTLKSNTRYEEGNNYCAEPDWHLTTIKVSTLKAWLQSRGYTEGFFFSDNVNEPDYLNKDNEFYAPKLATAVRAWQAITNDISLLNNKTPKQALEVWLKTNAKEFDLIDEEGNHIKQAIEDIAKVANWKPKGGATKTPTKESFIKPCTFNQDFATSYEDDDIPF